MHTQTIRIGGLTCLACTKLTAKRLRSIEGVEDVLVDLDSGRTDITANRPVPITEVQAALQGSNYSAEEYHE